MRVINRRDLYGQNLYNVGGSELRIKLNQPYDSSFEDNLKNTKYPLNFTIAKQRQQFDLYVDGLIDYYDTIKDRYDDTFEKLGIYIPITDSEFWYVLWTFQSIVTITTQWNNAYRRVTEEYDGKTNSSKNPYIIEWGMQSVTKCMLDTYNTINDDLTINDITAFKLDDKGNIILDGNGNITFPQSYKEGYKLNNEQPTKGTQQYDQQLNNLKVGFTYWLHILRFTRIWELNNSLKYWTNVCNAGQDGIVLKYFFSPQYDFIPMIQYEYGLDRAIAQFSDDYYDGNSVLKYIVNDLIELIFWFSNAFYGHTGGDS